MISYIDPYIFQTLLPETQAIIDRAVLESFTLPNNNTINHINSLIKELKDIGYWQKRDLILNKAYNDTNLKDFTRINWKNPNGNLGTYVGGPLYTVNGIQAIGTTTDYYDSNYNYSLHLPQYTLSDAGRDVVIMSTSIANPSVEGSNGNFPEALRLGDFNTQRILQGSNSLVGGNVDMTGNGYKSISRLNSEDIVLFNNDVEYNRTATATTIPNNNLNLLRGNNLSGGDIVIGYYSIGGSINELSQDFRIAYNKFLTNIGLSL